MKQKITRTKYFKGYKKLKNVKMFEDFSNIPGINESLGLNYSITAQAFDRETGEAMGDSRDEEINIQTNRLFTSCKTILDIKNAYESFWNDLNPNSEHIVFVQKITKK